MAKTLKAFFEDVMSLLSRLHPKLKLAASSHPSSENEIQTLLDFSPIAVPEDYLALIRHGSELEIGVDLGAEGYWFIRIYGAATAIRMNEAYHVQRGLPQALAIGDNEGGEMLLQMPSANPPGIYHIPMSCLSDMEESTYIAASLEELLTQGKNLDLVFLDSDDE